MSLYSYNSDILHTLVFSSLLYTYMYNIKSIYGATKNKSVFGVTINQGDFLVLQKSSWVFSKKLKYACISFLV